VAGHGGAALPDLEQLKVTAALLDLPSRPRRKLSARGTRQAPFVKGPVPWEWLCAAGALPGKALHVGIYLWFLAGFGRSHDVALSVSAAARAFGCDRATASRGLRLLQRAGLVEVAHHAGRKPTVTIRDRGRSAHGHTAGGNDGK
jgi:DNA-binding MarR family transcriptional regulator